MKQKVVGTLNFSILQFIIIFKEAKTTLADSIDLKYELLSIQIVGFHPQPGLIQFYSRLMHSQTNYKKYYYLVLKIR